MGELKTITMEKSKAREEQLKRERLEIERRKREIREKRRKMRRIRFVAAWTSIICVTLIVLILIVSGISGLIKDDEENTTEKESNKEVTEEVFDPSVYQFSEEMYKYENSVEILERFENLKSTKSELSAKVEFMLQHEKAYPENLLKLVSKSPETIDFALEYPFKAGQDDTIVVDLSSDYVEGEIPHLLQWDDRWGYVKYGENTIALDGCGPTCLSMVAVGLTGNVRWTPVRISRMSMENDHYAEGQGTAWTLMYEGCEMMGLTAKVIGLSEEEMVRELNNNRPIIASMAPGDFTDAGHFIVIVDYKNGEFYVNDPNSKKNSAVGWSYDRLKSQIKNMWSYTLSK